MRKLRPREPHASAHSLPPPPLSSTLHWNCFFNSYFPRRLLRFALPPVSWEQFVSWSPIFLQGFPGPSRQRDTAATLWAGGLLCVLTLQGLSLHAPSLPALSPPPRDPHPLFALWSLPFPACCQQSPSPTSSMSVIWSLGAVRPHPESPPSTPLGAAWLPEHIRGTGGVVSPMLEPPPS